MPKWAENERPEEPRVKGIFHAFVEGSMQVARDTRAPRTRTTSFRRSAPPTCKLLGFFGKKAWEGMDAMHEKNERRESGRNHRDEDSDEREMEDGERGWPSSRRMEDGITIHLSVANTRSYEYSRAGVPLAERNSLVAIIRITGHGRGNWHLCSRPNGEMEMERARDEKAIFFCGESISIFVLSKMK